MRDVSYQNKTSFIVPLLRNVSDKGYFYFWTGINVSVSGNSHDFVPGRFQESSKKLSYFLNRHDKTSQSQEGEEKCFSPVRRDEVFLLLLLLPSVLLPPSLLSIYVFVQFFFL